jgi:arsenate reductase
MAEAWTRALKGSEYEPYSAGVEVKPLDPRAVKAMAEVGIDISMQQSKHIDSVADREFDYVVTLCSHAQETCPFFPAKTKVLHKGFDDPPVLAAEALSEEEAMHGYRRVRDEIRDFVSGFPETLAQT